MVNKLVRKAKSQSGFNSKAFNIISNKILSSTLPDSIYQKNLATFLGEGSDSSFNLLFPKLLKNKRFFNSFRAYATTLQDLESKPFFRVLSPRRQWLITSHIFSDCSEKLNIFVKLRNSVETMFFQNEFGLAEEELEKVKTSFGESLWYFRIKMLILSETGRTDELQRFYEKHIDLTHESIFSYFLKHFKLIADSDDPSYNLENLILKNTDEFRHANLKSFASLLELMFAPYPLLREFDYSECLQRIPYFSLIDQYQLVLQVLQKNAIKDFHSLGRLSEESAQQIEQLSASIDDELLTRLKSANEVAPSLDLTPVGQSILESYNRGNYVEALANFNANRTSLHAPIAYINIIAKSMAYIGSSENHPLSGSIVGKLTENLSSIYKMSGLWTQAVDYLTSCTIKYWCFNTSFQIQLALYKALPNYFPEESRKSAALLAVISCRENTPLSIQLSHSTEMPEIDGETPIYRKTKKEILAKIYSDTFEGIESDLNQFEILSPSKKDYLEIYSSYSLRFNQIESLIALTANHLVRNQNTMPCFPMKALLDAIETKRLSTIEAVVVAFAASKLYSTKDYVLNEAFEEYILRNSASKPSEILEKISHLSEVEIAFYKDICIREVMDFLSCFNDTNELWTERIRILDMLLEREAIDNSTRMKEFEEIVTKVTIEAGTSSFNGSKIYADDVTLCKKHIEEIKTLIFGYQNSENINADRVALIEKEHDGTSLAFLSGSKNALILKIYQILRKAFLFDEKHGLDKNLSAEIRHGFFGNLMRARLEEKKLITEADENGKFIENSYWMEANEFVQHDLLLKIDDLLKEFSEGINSLIGEAEEWMQIVTNENTGTREFKYDLSFNELGSIKALIEHDSPAEKIAEQIMNLMWEQTEVCIANIRNKLNSKFRKNIDDLFEKLTSGINAARSNVAFFDLLNSIAVAREEIKNDISTVVDWFQRTEKPEIYAESLYEVVEIAITSFEKIKGAAFGIDKEIDPTLREKSIPKREVKPLIIAIVNLLDNCYRHSGLRQDTRVQVKGSIWENVASLKIQNDLCDYKKNSEFADYILNLIDSTREVNSQTLIRKEGGSGVGKALHLIESLEKKASLTILPKDHFVIAEIQYDI